MFYLGLTYVLLGPKKIYVGSTYVRSRFAHTAADCTLHSHTTHCHTAARSTEPVCLLSFTPTPANGNLGGDIKKYSLHFVCPSFLFESETK